MADYAGANIVFTHSSDKLYRTTNFGDTDPDWTEIAYIGIGSLEDGSEIRDVAVDPFSLALLETGNAIHGYVLTDEALYRSEDMEATSPTWAQIRDVDNYKLIRCPRSLQGSVVLYTNERVIGPSTTTKTMNFDGGDELAWEIAYTTDPVHGGAYQEALDVWFQPPQAAYVTAREIPGYGGSAKAIRVQGSDASADHVEGGILIDLGDDVDVIDCDWKMRVTRTGGDHQNMLSGFVDFHWFDSNWNYIESHGQGTGTWADNGRWITKDLQLKETILDARYVFVIPSTSGNSGLVCDTDFDNISIRGLFPGGTFASVMYLENYGTVQVSERTFGGGPFANSLGMDIDDHADKATNGLIRAAGRDGQIYKTTEGYSSNLVPIINPDIIANPIANILVWPRQLNRGFTRTLLNMEGEKIHGSVGFKTSDTNDVSARWTEDDFVNAPDFTPPSTANPHIAGGPYAFDMVEADSRQGVFTGYDEDSPSSYKVYRIDITADGTVTYTPSSSSFEFNMVGLGQNQADHVYAAGPNDALDSNKVGVGFSDDSGATFIAKTGSGSTALPDSTAFLKVVPLPALAGGGGGAGPYDHKLAYCPYAYGGDVVDVTSPNPLVLRNGDKVVNATDLTVQTPAGPLAFTRAYVQSKLGVYNTLGDGWTHNHNLHIVLSGTSPNRSADVVLPNGGVLKLDEDSGNPGTFIARVGSTSEMVYSSGNDEYTLTAQDQTTTFFDGTTGRIKSRSWPSGETWTYAYANASGLLSEVDDGYGRKLKFSYISNPGNFDDRLLWRVGDNTASGLDTGSPSGRFVEYAYTDLGGNAYLTGVTDVLSEDWGYIYDGTAPHRLLKRLSPELDTDGDGAVETGSEIILEELSYTLDGSDITAINQKRGDGLLESDFAFGGGESATTVTVVGRTAKHHFGGGVYQGAEDPLGNRSDQSVSGVYRPVNKQDPNGNATVLAWSADGKLLKQVTDALSNVTQFNYDSSDRLENSLDAEGRKTAYTYGDANNERLPTQVDVYDDAAGTALLQRQQFTYDSMGRVLTEKTIDPSDGTTELRRTERTYYATGDGAGLLETVTQKDLVTPANDMTTTYFYDTLGRTVQVNQSSTFGSCTKSYTIYDAAGHVVASICNFDPTHDPTNPLADAEDAIDLREATTDPNANRVTVHEYDTLGRRFKTITEAGTDEARASLTVYDSLDRVVRSIANYVADAAVPNPFTADRDVFEHGTDGTHNRLSETVFDARGLVVQQIDPQGNITLIGYDDAGRQVRVIRNASQPGYNIAADPELADYLPIADADMDIITASGYDANGNLVKSIDVNGNVTFTVYDALNRVIQTVRNAKAEATLDLEPGDPGYSAGNDPRTMLYDASAAPDTDLITRSEYDAMGRVVRSWDVLEHVTLTGYDTLGRQVKTIRSASQPDYDLVSDPDLSAYVPSANADEDIISTTTYDEAGQVLYTEDVNANKSRLVYDGLGRQVRSIRNWVDNSVDPADWVWDAVDSRWEDGAGNPINHGDADQNIIAHTHFDSDGRVEWTQDVLNRLTRHVYDDMGRRVRSIQHWIDNSVDPADWIWDSTDGRWEDGSGNPIDLGANYDQNLISDTIYDDSGRVAYTRDSRGNETHNIYDEAGRRIQTITNYGDGVFDPATPDEDLVQTTVYDGDGRVLKTVTVTGIATRFVYDRLGRRTQTIANFVDGQFNPDRPDEDLTSTTVYNKGGQVVASIDARSTRTEFTYDAAGRRLTITQAAGTDLATTSYTCYDKAGRTLRVIRNWIDNGLSPDAVDANGDWLFAPSEHGPNNDRNLISIYQLDKLGRVVSTTDVLGNVSSISFAKDGRALAATNPAGVSSANRYDGLRRLTRVVQNHVTNGVDPADWIWNTTQWEDGSSNAIVFGTDNDQNIIVDVELDLVGRRSALRDPRGNRTTYAYDALNRRTGLTDPLSHTWTTAHALLSGGGSRVTVSDPLGHDTQQDFDRLGRLAEIAYLSESPKLTPDVRLAYDGAGNRVAMTESVDGWNTLERGTGYRYDAARRLVGVDVDRDGDGAAEQAVEYEYDAGGMRTRLVLPDGKALVYTYDERGQLRALSDWDNQVVSYRYDETGRRVSTIRADAFQTLQDYDAAGRLTQLEHRAEGVTLGRFAYTLDALGNRVSATDVIRQPDSAPVVITYDDTDAVTYNGNWTNGITEDFDASLQIAVYSEGFTLKLGTGDDRSLCDVYVDNVFWGSLDTYAATPGELAVTIPLARLGLHVVEIRNRPERNKSAVPSSATSFKLEFKQLETAYDGHAIDYSYDDLSRLLAADYFAAWDGVNPVRDYTFAYDVAGNRTSEVVNVDGSPFSSQTHTYDAANRISSTGFAYNDAGQMTADGTLSYSWDRAGRLLGAGDSSYAYNGLGQRVQQTVSGVVTDYLLDVQPGLAKVIAATTGANTERYVHERGLLSQQDSAGDWHWAVNDGLGSVRVQADGDFDVEGSRLFAPYGAPFDEQGTFDMPFAFTGEMLDANGLQYHRARYLNPVLGVFPSLDPVEGVLQQAMSLNRYAYVAGNVVNLMDPSGFAPSCNPLLQTHRLRFTYIGSNAAHMGIWLSLNWNDFKNDYQVSPVGEHQSARFMSFSIYLGNFPMTNDPAKSYPVDLNSDVGWRARLDGLDRIEGNHVWNNHNRNKTSPFGGMVGYISGESQTAGSGITGLNASFATIDKSIFSDPIWQYSYDVLPDGNRLSTAMTTLQHITTGDYVYGRRNDSGDTHSFLVIGWGPAIRCNSPELDEQSLGYRVLRGSFNASNVTSGNQPLVHTANPVDVPYVVDVPGKQRGTARPFYCSIVPDEQVPGDNTFTQEDWRFYKFPSVVGVEVTRLYNPPTDRSLTTRITYSDFLPGHPTASP